MDIVTWSKNGAVIDTTSTDFSYEQTLTDPSQAVYMNVLSSEVSTNFVGTFTCELDDADSGSNPVSQTFTVNGEIIIMIITNNLCIIDTRLGRKQTLLKL